MTRRASYLGPCRTRRPGAGTFRAFPARVPGPLRGESRERKGGTCPPEMLRLELVFVTPLECQAHMRRPASVSWWLGTNWGPSLSPFSAAPPPAEQALATLALTEPHSHLPSETLTGPANTWDPSSALATLPGAPAPPPPAQASCLSPGPATQLSGVSGHEPAACWVSLCSSPGAGPSSLHTESAQLGALGILPFLHHRRRCQRGTSRTPGVCCCCFFF